MSGVVTYREGEPTGALPGTLVRGAQPEEDLMITHPAETPFELRPAPRSNRWRPTPSGAPATSPIARCGPTG